MKENSGQIDWAARSGADGAAHRPQPDRRRARRRGLALPVALLGIAALAALTVAAQQRVATVIWKAEAFVEAAPRHEVLRAAAALAGAHLAAQAEIGPPPATSVFTFELGATAYEARLRDAAGLVDLNAAPLEALRAAFGVEVAAAVAAVRARDARFDAPAELYGLAQAAAAGGGEAAGGETIWSAPLAWSTTLSGASTVWRSAAPPDLAERLQAAGVRLAETSARAGRAFQVRVFESARGDDARPPRAIGGVRILFDGGRAQIAVFE